MAAMAPTSAVAISVGAFGCHGHDFALAPVEPERTLASSGGEYHAGSLPPRKRVEVGLPGDGRR